MNLTSLTALTAASVALALSDGTPVEFVKITSKDRIQVRVPTTHPLGAEDPLRIFGRDGSHYKGRTDLSLTVLDAAADTAMVGPSDEPVPADGVAVASNDNTTYEVGGETFDNIDDAREEAIALYAGDRNIEITSITRAVAGVVGFVAAA